MMRLALAIIGVTLTAACINDRPAVPRAALLPDDRLCELWVGHALRQVTDLWRRRYAVTVSCQSPQPVDGASARQNSENGEIMVTVTLANGEPEQTPEEAGVAEKLLRSALESIVERQGWTDRYTMNRLQFLR
jgi:hypothetical protein